MSFLRRLFRRQVEHILYYWDYENRRQDETETNPAGVSGQDKWEINVSKKGRHVFATDSFIRTYTSEQVRDLILLFREKFPEAEGYRVTASPFRCRSTGYMPDYVTAALEGHLVKTKVDKTTKIGQIILDNVAEEGINGVLQDQI